MKDSFTDALLKAICDRLETCFEESDIGLRELTIVCPNSDSKIGTLFAILNERNATIMVEGIKQVSDDLAVDLGNGLSLSLSACDINCPLTATEEPLGVPSEESNIGLVQSLGLVAGVVISVIFLVAMVIAAAILLTVIVFKYR